ncbi:MAG: lysine--tRNA ligase [Parcubacteria group bacterium]
MASLEEIRSARLQKLEILKSKGINPYPASVPRDFPISFLKTNFDAQVSSGANISIAGRIMAIRGQGAILFAVIFDGTEKIQAIIKKDSLSEENFSLFTDVIDIGDFISVTGVAMLSKTGEQSIMASSWIMAGKSLLPLPEKWHGLQDVDERYRKRYLDFLMNEELRDLIVKKSQFWTVAREFLKNEGFLEVETPSLEVTTGGAEARPFKTHHNDFDLDVFLRISVGELWQKRLMAGGFEKTFEIGRAYRNEGSSPEHLQEFTNLEFYASYMTFEDGKELVKKLFTKIAKDTFGKTEFETRGHKFDLASKWEELDYVDTVKKMTGVDVLSDSVDTLKGKLDELGVKFDGNNRERMTDSLWKYCRKSISGPAFLVNHPKVVAPLSKENPNNSNLTETFQVIIAGSEVGRAHAELNDPIDQATRFSKQKELIEGGDEEAMMSDHEYVEMMEHGMPPTFGFGFGERFFAFLADKPLRELQTFPLMRPKAE